MAEAGDGPMFDGLGDRPEGSPQREPAGYSHSASAASGRQPRGGGRRSGLSRARRIWAVLALLLSAAALAVELTLHICAGFFFDPLPDGISVIAYLFLTGMLGFNEYVLRVTESRPAAGSPEGAPLPALARQRLLGLARVWTAAALAVAAAYTVMFVPLLPFSILGVMFMGIGLCAWSPLLNLAVVTAQSRALASRWRELGLSSPRRVVRAGWLCAAATAALLVGRPLAIGYLLQRAVQSRTERGASVAGLRFLHAEPEVLNLCYRNTPEGTWVAAGRYLASPGLEPDAISEARKVYYLMTGRPFETEDASRIVDRVRGWTGLDPVTEQQGGELVGSAIRGLSLFSSRLDGVMDPRSETAYCEWTLVFKNSSAAPQEARAEILLPEGGVVDKASLYY